MNLWRKAVLEGWGLRPRYLVMEGMEVGRDRYDKIRHSPTQNSKTQNSDAQNSATGGKLYLSLVF
jgi:hypothetical protein